MISFMLFSVTMAALASYYEVKKEDKSIESLTLTANADRSVDVKKGGKIIGRLSYSYKIQPGDRGCFIHVEIINETGEFVRGRITGTGTECICGTSFKVNPHGKIKEVFGSAETPKDIILEYVQIDD